SNHLVAQLAHSEDDDRGLEIDVGGRAEHAAEAAGDPSVENQGDARVARKAFGDVAENRLGQLLVGVADGPLDHRAFGLVEAAADARAEIDRVGGSGPEPGLVVDGGGLQVKHVERVAGTKSELDVDAAELSRQL